jgi:hypothetical protein
VAEVCPLGERSRRFDGRRMQTLVLWYLVALARAEGRRGGAVVFEIEVAELSGALYRLSDSLATDEAVRLALDDLMGPESIVPDGALRLDVLPCDGLPVPERYRVLFTGDLAAVEPPPDALA